MIIETIIVTVLTWYDRFMDIVTRGRWTQMNGDVMPSLKVKE